MLLTIINRCVSLWCRTGGDNLLSQWWYCCFQY